MAHGVDLRHAAVCVDVYVASSEGSAGLDAACATLTAWLEREDGHDDNQWGDGHDDNQSEEDDNAGLVLGGALAAAHADGGGSLPLDPYLATRDPLGGALPGGPLVNGVLVPQLPRGWVPTLLCP